MTPNELTTLLAEPLGRQFDEPFKLMTFDRGVAWYARLLRNSIEKDPRRRKEFYKAVVLRTAPIVKNGIGLQLNNECDVQNLDLNFGCSIVQTVKDVPKSLFVNGIVFDYVGGAGGDNPFGQISNSSVLRFYKYNKYQKSQLYYSYINSKIQVYDDPRIRVIRVDGIFLNLKDVHECTCDALQKDWWNTNLDIADDILQQMIQFVSQEINPKLNTPVTDEIKLKTEQGA